MSGFNFMDGGTLESMGALTGMDASLEGGRTVLLTGSNAVWNLGTNQLTIGTATSSNGLYITEGALMGSSGAVLGSLSSTGSVVFVGGGGSLWTNSGSLALEGYYNDLIVADGGQVIVNQSLSVRNQSALSFVGNASVSAAAYYQDATSVFTFDTITNTLSNPALLTVAGDAEFESGATIEYTGNIGGVERGIVFTNRLVDAGMLIVNGVTNATTADLDALNLAGLGSLLTIDLVSDNDDLIALIARLSLADSAGFAPGSSMANLSDEIDLLADNADPRANNMLNTLAGFDSAKQNAQLSQLYDRHAPTHVHAKSMLEGFRQARLRGVVPGSMLPAGAFGPHFYSEQVQGWIKGFGSLGERDRSDALAGYEQTTYGMLVGVDKSYGDLLAGIAGGRVKSDIDQDDGDVSEATTGFGMLYASWGTISWFGDFNIGYGRSSIDDRSGTAFDTTAAYDADLLGFYLGGGNETAFRDDRVFVTPSAALSGSYYLQESYIERSTTAVPRRVDEFDYLSLQSELGLKASFMHDLRRSVLVPEAHVNWMHEFNADEERVGYSLVGGTGGYSYNMQAPVEDFYEFGIGLSWWMYNRERKVFEWYIGLDQRIGDGYSETTGSLRLLGQF